MPPAGKGPSPFAIPLLGGVGAQSPGLRLGENERILGRFAEFLTQTGLSGCDNLADVHSPGDNPKMTLFAHAMLILFIIAWFVAVGAWFYGTCFFLPMWANRFHDSDDSKGYGRKVRKSYAIFVGAIIFGFAVGGLAQLAGGWGQ